MNHNSSKRTHGARRDGTKKTSKSHAPSSSSSRGHVPSERQTPASNQHRGSGHNIAAEGYSDDQSRWSSTTEAGTHGPYASYDDLAGQDRAREERRAYAMNHSGIPLSTVAPYTPPTSQVDSINVNEIFGTQGYHASSMFGYPADLELDDEGQRNSAHDSSGYSQY